jgi:hypothetical protein
MLGAILNLYKLERFNMLDKAGEVESIVEGVKGGDGALKRELRAASRVPLIMPEVEQILRHFAEFNPLDA